ncbi:MAG: DUF177 domain-containing protein [Alphaproteobacteria bacterium]|nr:DUF177 domain-containing protein [Alphaproteobacteria bacterium]
MTRPDRKAAGKGAVRRSRRSPAAKGKAVPAPEFSRRLTLEELGDRPLERRVAADPAERAALARRFGLVALDRLEAALTLTPGEDGTVTVEGRLEARLSQACVVTLEPVPADIDEPFRLVYAPAATPPPAADFAPDDDDPPEAIVDGAIDLGEIVAEQLGLALDPYPRKPGIAFEGYSTGPAADQPGPSGPFAALATLRQTRR